MKIIKNNIKIKRNISKIIITGLILIVIVTNVNCQIDIIKNLLESVNQTESAKLLDKYYSKLLNSNSFNKEYLYLILIRMFEIFKTFFISPNIYLGPGKENYDKCVNLMHEELIEFLTTKSNLLLSQLFELSGKDVSDIGNMDECIRGLIRAKENNDTELNITDKNYFGLIQKNLSYFFIVYQIHDNNIFTNLNDEEIFRFLNKKYYYTGLCLPIECSELVHNILNENVNYFLSLYKNFFTVDNVTETNNNKEKQTGNTKSVSYIISRIFIYFCLIYFAIKIIMSCIRIICFSHGYQQANYKIKINKEIALINEQIEEDERKRNPYEDFIDDKELNEFGEEDNDELYDETYEEYKMKMNYRGSIFSRTKSKSKSKSKLKNQNLKNKKYFFENNSDDYPFKLRLVKFLDFFDNIHQLSSPKSTLYKDKGLEQINCVKFIVLILIVVNQTFEIVYNIPGINFTNYLFFENFQFFLIKLSINSYAWWIILEGAVTCYKIMMDFRNDILEKQTKKTNLKIFLKFFLLSIPKIIGYIIILYIFEIYYEHILSFFHIKSPYNDYYKKYVQQKKVCYEKRIIYYIFTIPWMSKYNDNKMDSCFIHASIYISIFYSFILFLIYIFILFKIKNSKFDSITLILFILTGIACTYLTKRKQNFEDYYNLNLVLGEHMSEKFISLIFNYYLLGILVGMCYFYHNDVMSNKSLVRNTENYFPFSICFYIIKALDTLKYSVKLIIFYICLFIILILSFTFYIIVKKQGNLEIKMNNKYKFQIITEKEYNAIIFVILLLLFKVYPEDTFVKNLSNSNFFIVFSRIGYCFFSLTEFIIYFLYFTLELKANLYYDIIYQLSLANFILIFIISLIYYSMYEMPFRIFIKNIIYKFTAIDNKKIIDKLAINNDFFEMSLGDK